MPDLPVPQPAPESDRERALRREAASRRAALRDVERERDALRERVQRQERQQVEAIATQLGYHRTEDALLLLGDRSVLLDDEGFLDSERARETLTALAAERPYLLAAQEPKPERSTSTAHESYPDLHGGARGHVEEDRPVSFGAALKGQARR